MGYREISLNLPTDYVEEQLRKRIEKELKIRGFSYQIENKSLDARKKEQHNTGWFESESFLKKSKETNLSDLPL